MVEFEAWCETCRKETGFELVAGELRCEVCGGARVGAASKPDSAAGKSCLKAMLIMLAIGLVILAFVFASCSGLLGINR